jgi:uncharacterized protein YggE
VRTSILSLALAFGIAISAIPAAVQAQGVEKTITVIGEGTTSVVPDIALIRGGVTTQGKTAREASEANSKDMQAVIAALKEAGVAERDIQTTRLSIYPQMDPNKSGKARIVGFQATNQVNVRLHDLTKIAAALDQMIAAGANEISGISFSVTDPSKALDTARKDAVVDARRKAEIYAQAAGVRLGRAVQIQEEGTAVPFQPRSMAMRAAAPSSVPVSPGEEMLRVNVSISFELMH